MIILKLERQPCWDLPFDIEARILRITLFYKYTIKEDIARSRK